MISSGQGFYSFLLTLFIVSFLLSSCNSKKPDPLSEQNEIYGKWLIHMASRDGRETETLKDTYFQFKEPDILINNLQRGDQTYSYTMIDSRIEQRGKVNMDFEILRFQADTLILRTEIRDYDIRFFLIRDSIGGDEVVDTLLH